MCITSTPEAGKAFIVLSDNHWLYAGFAALQLDVCWYHVRFSGEKADDILPEPGVVLLLVDCSIFYSGEWQGFRLLMRRWLQASVVWLIQDRKGVRFPSEHEGDGVVNQRVGVPYFKAMLHGILHQEQTGLLHGSVAAAAFSTTEALLLPLFLRGRTVHQLSVSTGRSVKTLYGNQRKILDRLGFIDHPITLRATDPLPPPDKAFPDKCAYK